MDAVPFHPSATELTDHVPVIRFQRQPGKSSPTITRHATSSSHRGLIFRDDRVPVAELKISNVSIIRGSVLSLTAGRVATPFTLVVRRDRTDIELPHGIPQEVNQRPLRQPVLRRRRQQPHA